MKDKAMFPYRRGNKKRGKGGGAGGGGGMARRHRDGGGGRRAPSGAHELLPLLQPATKALAQMLAGNTKASGQLVHARNILAQAERLIEERQVERMIPAHREEFLEQLARLKLTLADAALDEIEEAAEQEAAAAKVPAPPVSAERLRALALSLATSLEEPAAVPPAPMSPVDDEPDEAEQPKMVAVLEEPGRGNGRARGDIPAGSPRHARLRLKSESGDEPKPRDERA
jgi:hypothetical protein